MRRMSTLLIALALITVAMIGCVSAAADTTNDHVIQATGDGKVIGTPDRAQVTFSAQIENADVKIAQAQNAVMMNNVITALKNAGLPQDALKTTGYNIYPVYDTITTPFGQKIKSYSVTNTLTVTLHDVNRTGEVIDIAVANGINKADSIQFMLSEEQSKILRTEALKEAVAQAKSDADAVAAAMGTTITGVQSAEIGGGYSPVLFQNYADIGAAAKSVAPTPIQPGDVTITASVTITYLIR